MSNITKAGIRGRIIGIRECLKSERNPVDRLLLQRSLKRTSEIALVATDLEILKKQILSIEEKLDDPSGPPIAEACSQLFNLADRIYKAAHRADSIDKQLDAIATVRDVTSPEEAALLLHELLEVDEFQEFFSVRTDLRERCGAMIERLEGKAPAPAGEPDPEDERFRDLDSSCGGEEG